MRWSQLHIPTLRDDPADADAASHRLLLRAGFIRQLMAGHYSLLPLGIRVRAKVMRIIREEMNRIGGQEFLLPCMQPAHIWEKSGRLEVMGEEMFRLRDRRGAEVVLGMTHEEIFATLALEFASYRELPQFWYQFQTKFRDEPRPKSGLLRVREFTMKDSYSFDVDEAGLDASFERHRGAYERIFARLGIPAIAVEASSGNMGGSDSIEFMCPSSAGEDLVATCPNCGYAANLEKAISALPPITDPPGEPGAAPGRLDTPGVRTIEQLATDYGLAADREITVTQWADLREVTEGEPCPRCAAALELVRAIEIGHIFKLGRKYTTALGVTVSMADGSTVIPIMGSYGIGVERAMAVIAEVHHDDVGLAWPVQVAPAEVSVLLLSVRDPEARAAADVLYASLLEAGVDTMIDDRDVRPGVKYADAELTGIPFRISVGTRDLAEGVVEITKRANGEKERVAVGEAVSWVRQAIAAASG